MDTRPLSETDRMRREMLETYAPPVEIPEVCDRSDHDRSECPGCCVERGSDDQRE